MTGEMVYKGGAGPAPIPHKQLSVDRLAEALKYCTTARATAAAERMGAQIRAENGVQEGVLSFYRHLPLLNMRCGCSRLHGIQVEGERLSTSDVIWIQGRLPYGGLLNMSVDTFNLKMDTDARRFTIVLEDERICRSNPHQCRAIAVR